MSRPWMPLYIADYLQDTTHLSAAEHGAYLLLIMHYWANGSLPTDDRRLARIVRMNAEEWASAKETIADYFEDDWRHLRIELELVEADEKYERRAAAGQAGGVASGRSRRKRSIASQRLQAKAKQTGSNAEPTTTTTTPVANATGVRTPRSPSVKVLLPDGWRPSEDLNPIEEAEFEKMRDWAKAGAIKRADWMAQWRNWLRNTGNFQPRRQHGSSQSNGLQRAIERLANDDEFDGGQETGATIVRLLPNR